MLAVAGDDHACKSSTLPHQSEHMFVGASVPVLAPSNVQEVLDLGIFGWELSRFSGCWVALKAITENMDSAISADIDPDRVRIEIPTACELPPGGVSARAAASPGIEAGDVTADFGAIGVNEGVEDSAEPLGGETGIALGIAPRAGTVAIDRREPSSFLGIPTLTRDV